MVVDQITIHVRIDADAHHTFGVRGVRFMYLRALA